MNYQTFKNKLERMFKSGQLRLPKATQKPNNDENPLRDLECIIVLSNQEWE